MEAAFVQNSPTAFALGDFWSLTQQAGPLRWPIFFVLGVGLVQVFVKLYELVRDRSVSKPLYTADLTTVSLMQITTLVARQEESMLSSLQSTMLNVFQTRPGEGMLHDEIANFVSFQQDQFGAFQRRMDFLSDTAGALGLMGTVWGMFTVFFQGTAEQEVILRGMGIALITTLLGLVVSIILNFSAMEVSTFFGKRLEQVSRKSDELRFRLLELNSETATVAPAASVRPAPSVVPEAPVSEAVTVEAVAPKDRSVEVPSGGEVPAPRNSNGTGQTLAAADKPAARLLWRYIELEGAPPVAAAGDKVDGVSLLVRTAEGDPAPGVPVVVSIPGNSGALDEGKRERRFESDDVGRIEFGCTAPDAVGPFLVQATMPEQPGPPTRIEIAVRPGPAVDIDVEGNHQAAVAGMRLPLPLGVRVSDRFGNPVPGVPVDFTVKEGGGRLASDAGASPTTGLDGRASTHFVVASTAGPNVVTARVGGVGQGVEFVAFGTEV